MKCERNNFYLVDGLFCKLDDKVQTSGVSSLPEDARVVHFIWAALGILENGSFQCFFLNALNPEATATAFEKIGLKTAAERFCFAKSFLPENFGGFAWDK